MKIDQSTQPGPSPGRRMLVLNAVIALLVATAWLTFGGKRALTAFSDHWPVALTMVPGSLVGGGTSEGGGAVGFPVLTKVLGVNAQDARLFTYAIQSVGMVSASLSILLTGVPVERRVLYVATPVAMVGGALSAIYLAPHASLPATRIAFTLVLAALGVALVIQGRLRDWQRHDRIPRWGPIEGILVAVCGAAGGVLSGVAGLGENTVMFILLVLLFRVSEKVATPTTVILLASVSLSCLLTHAYIINDFTEPVVGYWLAAMPVAAICAPLGAYLCTRMEVPTIRTILLALIAVEWASTLVLVTSSTVDRVVFIGATALVGPILFLLTFIRRYQTSPASAATPTKGRPTHALLRDQSEPQAATGKKHRHAISARLRAEEKRTI